MQRSYLSKYYNVDNVFRIVSCVADVCIKMESNNFLGVYIYIILMIAARIKAQRFVLNVIAADVC